MPVSLGSTFWKCPECGETNVLDGTDLSEIGTPYCDCKESQEMEPMDDPIPSVLYVDDEEAKILVGIVLRPTDISIRQFEKKVAKLWKKWLEHTSDPATPTFRDWLEANHDFLFLNAEVLTADV